MKLFEVACYLHNGYRDIVLAVAENKESAESMIKERYDKVYGLSYLRGRRNY